MRSSRSLCGLLLGAAMLSATPEFDGVVIAPEMELFALADRAGASPTRWVKRGETFAGYTVAVYSPATETLLLRRAGDTLCLHLREPKTIPLTADPAALLDRAKQEIARIEGWPEPLRLQGPHFFEGNWIIVAHHSSEGRTETRVIVFTAAGVLRDYQTP